MVKVYFETENGSYCELVAVFSNEEAYSVCFPELERLAFQRRMIVTESVDDKQDLVDIIEYGEEEKEWLSLIEEFKNKPEDADEFLDREDKENVKLFSFVMAVLMALGVIMLGSLLGSIFWQMLKNA